jgi:hypothetical protein
MGVVSLADPPEITKASASTDRCRFISVKNTCLETLQDLRTHKARPVSPPISEFSAPITFARDDPPMSDATATPEVKPHASLFTRLRVVEAELHTLKALFADLKEDHEALREDRDEWRWRAEYLLAEAQKGFFGRWGQRIEAAVKPFARRLNALI